MYIIGLLDYRTQAIILKSFRLNEADKVLHLYSLERGPIKAIAKSGYNSRNSGATQNINCCEFLLAEGKNFHIVKEVKLLEDFKQIKKSYQTIGLAFLLVEILDRIAITDDAYEIPYNALLEKLGGLNTQTNFNKQIVAVIEFLWLIIDYLGYKPELDICGHSKNRRQSHQIPRYFDLEQGSIISSTAFQNSNPYHNNLLTIEPSTFRLLSELEESGQIQNSSNYNDLTACFKLLNKHLEHNINQQFKSSSFVEALVA